MKKLKIIYDANMYKAFKKANEFCESERLGRIEVLFLVREIFKQEDCKVYDCILDQLYDSECIDDSMEMSVMRIVDRIGKERKTQSNARKVTISFTEKSEAFDVSEELMKMLSWIKKDQLEHFQEIEDVKDGEEILIDSNLFMEYVMIDMSNDMLTFFRRLNIKPSEIREELLGSKTRKKKKKVSTAEIPCYMSSFLTDITAEIKPKSEQLILGRNKESQKLWSIISKKSKRNAILVGDPGVGKTALMYKLATDIVHKNCPQHFKGYKVVALEVSSIIANTMYRGQAEERFEQVKKYLESNNKVILFIDEIHTMIGAGACEDQALDFSNSMKPILAGDKSIVIGATTEEEYEKYFSKDVALKRRFEKVVVKEPKADEVYPMLKSRIKDLEKFHGIKISKKIVDFIIFTASCFSFETKNPDRTLDLIDRSMVVAKNHNRKFVTKRDVLKNYDVNFETFEKMDAETKKLTAYHETGHYIMQKASPHLNDFSTIAVSIMPTESYSGVNAIEETDNYTVSMTLDYFIDEMAYYLAGRVAERKCAGTINAGVSSDLNKATKIAYDVVTKYALIPECRIALIREEEINLQTEQTTNLINRSIEELLVKAEKRAEEVLNQNEALLDTIVKELLENKMLSKKDLEEICDRIKSK